MCYLLTKTSSSIAINVPAEDIKLSDVSSTSCAQMSIINVSSSKDNPVFICCFQAKKRESSPDEEPTLESQISLKTGINATSNISQVNVIASANSCSQETRTNQPDTVDYTQDLQTSASLSASHPIATGGKTDSDSTTISHFCHRPKDERIDITVDQSDINVEDYDPLEKNCVVSKIHYDCKIDQVDHSKPCTIQTCDQLHASLAVGNISATKPDNDNLEVQCAPSTVNHQFKTCHIGKQPSLVQASHDTTQQSTSDGASENNLLEEKIEQYTTSEGKTGQIDHIETQMSTIGQSIFEQVSKQSALLNSCFKPVTIKDHHQAENTSSPSTLTKPPSCDDSIHVTINDLPNQAENRSSLSTPTKPPSFDDSTQTKQSRLESCYLDTGSWDPLCHHIEYHERNMTLPRDLRYLKSSELLPMAYGDFTKCLEDENLCCTPPEMMTMSGDDDGVVPSSSPLLPGDEASCYSTCSDTSTDASQEYTWECFSTRDETMVSTVE